MPPNDKWGQNNCTDPIFPYEQIGVRTIVLTPILYAGRYTQYESRFASPFGKSSSPATPSCVGSDGGIHAVPSSIALPTSVVPNSRESMSS